jgi:hypothetical protein
MLTIMYVLLALALLPFILMFVRVSCFVLLQLLGVALMFVPPLACFASLYWLWFSH